MSELVNTLAVDMHTSDDLQNHFEHIQQVVSPYLCHGACVEIGCLAVAQLRLLAAAVEARQHQVHVAVKVVRALAQRCEKCGRGVGGVWGATMFSNYVLVLLTEKPPHTHTPFNLLPLHHPHHPPLPLTCDVSTLTWYSVVCSSLGSVTSASGYTHAL